MELKTAIEILDYHQEWRIGKREDMIHEPKKLTEALDIVLSEVKKLLIHNVRKSFPLIEGKTKSNVKKHNGVGRQAPPPPPVRTIKGNVS
tara:strand:+ start:376 stop:645 length:270 start_codon:yes stop_codon:yes gene_type:complete